MATSGFGIFKARRVTESQKRYEHLLIKYFQTINKMSGQKLVFMLLHVSFPINN